MSGISPPELQRRRAIVRKVLPLLKKLFPHAGMMLKYSNNWELLVAVELSAQCTDKKVNEVTAKLFKKYRTLDDYVRASASRQTVRAFERDIFQTGFYRNKAKNILAAAKMVKKQFHGKLPKTMAEMLTIPGVGRKTANVVLGNAYGIFEGMAVDTHVRRLAWRLGLSRHTDPDKIEQDLLAVLPRHEWFPMTYRLIEYGRKYCPSRLRDHSKCPLAKYEI